jgi:hypothetical protein
MIYKTAYDTTIGKSLQMAKTIRAIQESAIKDGAYDKDFGLIKTKTEITPWFIASSTDSEAQIPFFNHPLLVELIDRKEKTLCIDIRPFATYNINSVNEEDQLRIKNKIELKLAEIRMKLNLTWLNNRPYVLRDISTVPMAIFSSWVSESVSRRFGLLPKDQMIIAIICCYYYYSLFNEHIDLTEEEKMRLVAATMKATKANSSMVMEVFEKITTISNVKELALVIKELTENTRLETFDQGMLVNLLINSWFGTNAREMIAVSLEHPPTWIALVYSSFVEKSYKNTVISKISQRYLGSKGENDFVRTLVTFINED